MQVLQDFARRNSGRLTLVAVAMLPVIAWADIATGSLIRLSVLYFVPVIVLAWLWGSPAGLSAALASLGFLIATEARGVESAPAFRAAVINAILRGLVLFLVAALVGRVARDRACLEQRVLDRTAALRESEARWRFAIEGNADGLWDWHIPSGKVFYSPMWKRMLGYGEGEIGDSLDEFSSRVHPEDRPRADEAVRDFIEGKVRFYTSEFRLRCRDGTWKWILDRGAVIERDAFGRPLRAIGTHADISHRKQVEQDLALFKAVIEASSEAVGIADPTGRIVYVNRAHERLFGPMKANLPHYFTPESVDILNSRITPALARGESCEVVLDATGHDGRVFPLWSRTDAIRDGDGAIQWMFGVMHDLTEARGAEEALRTSEERYRSVVTGLHEGIVVLAGDGRIETANAAAERILGLSLDEMQGRTSMDLRWRAIREDGSPFPGDNHPAAVTLRTGKPQWDVVMGVQRKEGELVWVRINTQAMTRPGEAEPYGVVASFVDITALRNTEQNLRASLQEKQALLMEVHHRVKNNLQVITSLLRLEAGQAAEPATRAVLKDMQSRIAAMALLHETIYKSGSFAALDLSDYLRQLGSHFFRAQVHEGAIRLTFDLDPAPRPVTIDQAVTCGLLVSELMTNALKHAFPAGRTGEMRIGLRSAGEEGVRLSVSDDGVGLPADFAARPVNSLGLLLVNDLARQLGGSIEIVSETGASFSVTFQPKPLPAP